MSNWTLGRSIGLAVTVLWLAGCAAPVDRARPTEPAAGPSSASPARSEAETVEQAATRYWTHLVNGNAAEAYEYLSPGYRQTISREQYVERIRNLPVRRTGAQFLDKDCPEPDVCHVRMMISFRITMAVAGVGEVSSVDFRTEKWIRSGGKWYTLPGGDATETLR